MNLRARVHRQLAYIYLLSVPSVSSRCFNKNKMNVLFREIARLMARNSFVLGPNKHSLYWVRVLL